MPLYQHPAYDPQLLDDIVRLVSEELNPLDLSLIAENFRQRGFDVVVREGRIADAAGIEAALPEVKFAPNKDNGTIEGIDTSYGHRWTITKNPNAPGVTMLDRKRKITVPAGTFDEAKGHAARMLFEEADHRNEDAPPAYDTPYAKPSYAEAFKPTPPLAVDQLRTMFPGHYLTK